MTRSNYMNGMESFSIPENATLIEQSVYKLRNAIMRGDIRPGQKLIEASLCATLNISRASLREALRVLEVEKLIELVHNRGPSVAKLGFQDVDEIHEVWALLTGQAVADFTRLARDNDIARLEAALANLIENNRASTPLGQLAAINAFFGTILSRCGNSVLEDMIISLVARVNFLRAQVLLHQGWGALYAEEIAAVLTKIKEGDPEGARVATQKHIATACTAAKKFTVELTPINAPAANEKPARGRRKTSKASAAEAA